MDAEEQKKPPTQLCTIRIGFPVDSDEQAIEYKKKVSDVLADIPQVRIDFGLIPVPPVPSTMQNA